MPHAYTEDQLVEHASVHGAVSRAAPCVEVQHGFADRGLLHMGDLPEMERAGCAFIPANKSGGAPRVGCDPSRNGFFRVKNEAVKK
jgi:hypothetical protein